MSGVRMAMSADFLTAFAKLPSQQQRGVRAMITRFERDSKATGLNYERIANAKDPNMRSLRIDGSYRAIVLKPAQGNMHMLLWADKHDEAYQWATRHACSINVETGALQVYEPRQVADPDSPPATTDKARAFGELKRRELMRLGVPAEMTDEVLELQGEAELEAMAPRLPIEAYEALYLYLAGESYDELVRAREAPAEPVDASDFATALEHNDSRSRFVVIEDDLELEEMFNAPLERWRVFLHPSQRRLVERSWNGPVRVLGGAGTGKTVVAMHRARWLARTLPADHRILFTTFTRNLAADIANNLQAICSAEELKRIEVTNLDRWVQRFLRGRRYRFRLVFGREEEAWREALAKKPDGMTFQDTFYEHEWEQVIQSRGVDSREEYLHVSRTGRGVRLNRAARARVWPVFEEYRVQLAERGVLEVADCYRAAAALLEEDRRGGDFAAVIVDEAQDLDAPAWQLIRSLAPSGKDDLFIVGDAHQRIYSRRRVVLSHCGIDIRGRARKLRLNYRTTEETCRWATDLLEGRPIDDLDGGRDDNKGLRSVAHGPAPVVRHFSNRADQAAWLIEHLAALEAQGEPLRGVCIVARTRPERDAIGRELSEAGLSVEVLETDSPDDSASGVRLATMHRVKGLEFDHIVIASANADTLPLPAAIAAADSPAAAETAERSLLYVAATRAKKELLVLSFGEPSPYLQ
ncbi:MAG: AAA family ATPase [Gammaproteobacteria bacterium]|nr:AAA family ATPase [Gammaproteobacteria bacterium]MYF09611.1 AAA family ATPase [Gammaproteobacteria bacterium]MYH15833.1 AAA family ATPase [Gammaproteobacteria bacterium]